jgi:hypothetical protein
MDEEILPETHPLPWTVRQPSWGLHQADVRGNPMKLLTRDQFREAVFARDGHKCVFCGLPAQDAHHILERRLWPDGGYYLDNGASVCGDHHLACERTDISVDMVRTAANAKAIVPPHLYSDQEYDKWGNPVLPGDKRLRGELFYDPSVQKVLQSHLSKFIDWVKYPRTHHVPWSENMNEDDRVMEDTGIFKNKRVIVTEKMDGENTTLYSDYIHARSVNSRPHESQTWVKQFRSQIGHDIPKGWRICGENLYAKHSIHYEDLPSYFMGFSIWNEANYCLDWPETVWWFEALGITPVPVIFDGIYDEQKIRALWSQDKWAKSEGYVVRLASCFSYRDFRYSVGKFVRKNHIQTVQHWRFGQRMEKNGMKV